MNSKKTLVVCALVAGLMTWGCGSDGGGGNEGGEIRGGTLENVMNAIALDFAQLLVDVAPSQEFVAEKGGAPGNVAVCPGGGSGSWVGDAFGSGTLGLDACNIQGITIDGSLTGFLDQFDNNLSANMFRGLVNLSGGASGELNITNMVISATLPIMDATTFWEVQALTESGEPICAWSGGGPCQGFGGPGVGQTQVLTGGTCDPQAEFNDCELTCFDVCGDGVAQFVECQDNGVCGCTCVTYNF